MLLSALSLTAALITGPGSTIPAKRVAVIIGINRSLNDTVPALRYADDDAVQFTELFRELGVATRTFTELDADTARIYPDFISHGAPTRARIQGALTELASSGTEELFLVYAGHGDIEAGSGYLTLADGKLSRQALIGEWLAPLKSIPHKHVILDACRAYFAVFARTGQAPRVKTRRPYLGPVDADDEALAHPEIGYILAASSDQATHEWGEIQSGVFSYQVRSALRGAADLNRDAVLEYRELAGYLWAASEAVPNEKYRPSFLVMPPEGQTEVLRLPEPEARLELPAARSVYLEDARGVRLLNAHASAPLSLWFPRGARPVYARETKVGTRYRLPVETGGVVAWNELKAEVSPSQTRGPEHDAFRHLFVEPLTPLAARRAEAAGAYTRRLSATSLRMEAPPPAEVQLPARSVRPAARTPWLWAGLATTGALTAGAVGLKVMTDRRFDDYQRASATAQPGLRSETETLNAAWQIAATGAALSLIATGVYYLWPKTAPEAAP